VKIKNQFCSIFSEAAKVTEDNAEKKKIGQQATANKDSEKKEFEEKV